VVEIGPVAFGPTLVYSVLNQVPPPKEIDPHVPGSVWNSRN
jgi:hypothetical protein